MKRAAQLLALVAVGTVFLVFIIRAIPDGDVRANPWTAFELSDDGLSFEVKTYFGGRCDRFAGWDVIQTDDRVEITANLWIPNNPTDCTLALETRRLSVVLEEPLGDRPVVGCGTDRCLQMGLVD